MESTFTDTTWKSPGTARVGTGVGVAVFVGVGLGLGVAVLVGGAVGVLTAVGLISTTLLVGVATANPLEEVDVAVGASPLRKPPTGWFLSMDGIRVARIMPPISSSMIGSMTSIGLRLRPRDSLGPYRAAMLGPETKTLRDVAARFPLTSIIGTATVGLSESSEPAPAFCIAVSISSAVRNLPLGSLAIARSTILTIAWETFGAISARGLAVSKTCA